MIVHRAALRSCVVGGKPPAWSSWLNWKRPRPYGGHSEGGDGSDRLESGAQLQDLGDTCGKRRLQGLLGTSRGKRAARLCP